MNRRCLAVSLPHHNEMVRYLVAVQKRVVTDTSDFKTLLSYNKYIRNVGFRTFPMHL